MHVEPPVIGCANAPKLSKPQQKPPKIVKEREGVVGVPLVLKGTKKVKGVELLIYFIKSKIVFSSKWRCRKKRLIL